MSSSTTSQTGTTTTGTTTSTTITSAITAATGTTPTITIDETYQIDGSNVTAPQYAQSLPTVLSTVQTGLVADSGVTSSTLTTVFSSANVPMFEAYQIPPALTFNLSSNTGFIILDQPWSTERNTAPTSSTPLPAITLNYFNNVPGSFNTSNGSFTAPYTGLYRHNMDLHIQAANYANWAGVFIMVNGIQTLGSFNVTSGDTAFYDYYSISADVAHVAGDIVQFGLLYSDVSVGYFQTFYSSISYTSIAIATPLFARWSCTLSNIFNGTLSRDLQLRGRNYRAELKPHPAPLSAKEAPPRPVAVRKKRDILPLQPVQLPTRVPLNPLVERVRQTVMQRVDGDKLKKKTHERLQFTRPGARGKPRASTGFTRT